ncbi:hypothetical protein [Crucivirus-536]|nr:hypothetical protein [Crucivirus-536]
MILGIYSEDTINSLISHMIFIMASWQNATDVRSENPTSVGEQQKGMEDIGRLTSPNVTHYVVVALFILMHVTMCHLMSQYQTTWQIWIILIVYLQGIWPIMECLLPVEH